MSGAGRSTAAAALEDLGWFVIDNLPPALFPEAIAMVQANSQSRRVAAVVDSRGGPFFIDVVETIHLLRSREMDVRVLFVDADDASLVRRFDSSRRPHPLQGNGRLLDGIRAERELLGDLRATADLVVDTSVLNIHGLRRAVEAAFPNDDAVKLRATVMSFGFKYGVPIDADIIADARFLPNPYWVPELRDQTGLDADVNDFVVDMPEAKEFLRRYASLIDLVAEGYLREGKRYVTVAVGCTGGKHRSVAVAENLGARLVIAGVENYVVHRDLGRE